MKLEIDSSRRLMGANLYSPRAGVVLDVELESVDRGQVTAAWEAEAKALLKALGWHAQPVVRLQKAGASLFFEAPLDLLLRATDVNEIAWHRACDRLSGDEPAPLASVVREISAWLAADRDTAFTELVEACAQRDVALMWDDDAVTLGLGTGSRTWPRDRLPSIEAIDWQQFHDIPFAMVTGTNGKSTTVRLLASIMRASGRTVGLNCTDWIMVDNEIVDRGDYAGPAGARAVLGNPRVELAAIEVARGGLLRRGVALESAPAIAITNVAEDHLGEYGIDDVEALADAKFVLLRALRPGGTLVANADDARVATRAEAAGCAICWFSLRRDNPLLLSARRRGQPYWYEDGGWLMYSADGDAARVVESAAVPVTMGGHARYNIANCLAAAALASALGLDVSTIRTGLLGFRSENEDNPGRGNLYSCKGAMMLVDFAHNVHGIQAVAKTVKAFPARRRLLMFGQAGHRTETELAEITAAALQLRPDRIVLTDSEQYLRGRAAMEVPRLLEKLCLERGVPADAISLHSSPLEGVRAAVNWAQKDDACLLLALSDREEIAAFLRDCSAAGSQDAVPPQENCG